MKIPRIFSQPDYIIALALLLILILVSVLLHFNGLYGQDAHEYLRLARSLDDFFTKRTLLPHSYFPILYPLSGLLISKLSGNDIVAMQLVSIFAIVLSFLYMKKLLHLIYG